MVGRSSIRPGGRVSRRIRTMSARPRTATRVRRAPRASRCVRPATTDRAGDARTCGCPSVPPGATGARRCVSDNRWLRRSAGSGERSINPRCCRSSSTGMMRVLSARMASARAACVRTGSSASATSTTYAHMVSPWASRIGCSPAVSARPIGTIIAARSRRSSSFDVSGALTTHPARSRTPWDTGRPAPPNRRDARRHDANQPAHRGESRRRRCRPR